MGTQRKIPLTQRRWPQRRLLASCRCGSSGTRRASPPPSLWAVTPFASSSASETSLRPVASNPTGGGLRGAVVRADGAAPVRPAASPSRPLCAALRASTSAPAESDRWGPSLRPSGCRDRLNRRARIGRRFALGRGGGSAIVGLDPQPYASDSRRMLFDPACSRTVGQEPAPPFRPKHGRRMRGMKTRLSPFV